MLRYDYELDGSRDWTGHIARLRYRIFDRNPAVALAKVLGATPGQSTVYAEVGLVPVPTTTAEPVNPGSLFD